MSYDRIVREIPARPHGGDIYVRNNKSAPELESISYEKCPVHFVNISDMKTLSCQLEPAMTCHQMKDKSNVATEITSRMPLRCGICDSNLRHVNSQSFSSFIKKHLY